MNRARRITTVTAISAGFVLIAGLVWGASAAIESSRGPVPPRPTSEPVRSPVDTSATTSHPDGGQGQLSAGECPEATVTVATANELTRALGSAQPGTVIQLAPGTYAGNFVASGNGTETAPIWLCGSSESILDGQDVSTGYVLHLNKANYWRLNGFKVTNGQKGVMADATSNSVIEGLTVTNIGNEGIHLRTFSVDNAVIGNTVSHTGTVKQKYGEGIYIGTAKSNWCDITDCEPDRSDRNSVANNVISHTTAENVDIKEGTTGGVLRGNSFDGSAITGADSWVDVKGNEWTITENTGVNTPEDGFQTHEILDGWGTDNVFTANTSNVNGPGFAIKAAPKLANVVHCNNTESGAANGLSNVECTGG